MTRLPGPACAVRLGVALSLALAVTLAACGDRDDDAAEDAATHGAGTAGAAGTSAALGAEVVVSAAASLTDVFDEIGAGFEAANPGVDVVLSYGPSSGLATQIAEGAPSDVTALASESTMRTVIDAGAVAGDPRVFATNDLVVVTEPGNPEGVAGVEDLPDIGIVALCGADVPCGTLAQEVLDNAGVTIPESSVTRGEDVRATLAAVSQGDAVAAIVYRTDAAAVGDAVETVPIPHEINAVATYPIAALTESADPAAAAFVEYVLSPAGQDVLDRAGFGPPLP